MGNDQTERQDKKRTRKPISRRLHFAVAALKIGKRMLIQFRPPIWSEDIKSVGP